MEPWTDRRVAPKTADIEQTLAYGVHGPMTLMVPVRHAQAVAERQE